MSRRAPQFSTRLPRWQKRALYTSFTLLATAGLCWLVFEYFVRIEGEFGPEHSPWQAKVLMIHGFACFTFLVAIGAMLPVHVRLGLLGKRSRKSGYATGAIVLFMALTGYGLYYIPDDIIRGWASTIHWIGGLTSIATISSHVWLGSRAPKARKSVKKPPLHKWEANANDQAVQPELQAAE